MARLTTIQTFASVSALKAAFHVTLPKPYEWRLLPECPIGSINGIPSMQGQAVATNGILVAIIQCNRLLIGHLDFFVADEQTTSDRTKAVTASSPKKPDTSREKKVVDVSEFI